MKPVPRRMVVKWIIDSWKQLSEELIVKSFRCCTVTLPTNGEADEISCFKSGKLCEAGRKMLDEQMKLLNNPEIRERDQFQFTDDDIHDAIPEFHIVDGDATDDEEDNLEIEID